MELPMPPQYAVAVYGLLIELGRRLPRNSMSPVLSLSPQSLPAGIGQMRRLGIITPPHPSQNQDDCFIPDRQDAGRNEAFEVLWEIGIHLAAFLAIALAIRPLLVLFGVVPVPA